MRFLLGLRRRSRLRTLRLLGMFLFHLLCLLLMTLLHLLLLCVVVVFLGGLLMFALLLLLQLLVILRLFGFQLLLLLLVFLVGLGVAGVRRWRFVGFHLAGVGWIRPCGIRFCVGFAGMIFVCRSFGTAGGIAVAFRRFIRCSRFTRGYCARMEIRRPGSGGDRRLPVVHGGP